jgi:hypothetical protein
MRSLVLSLAVVAFFLNPGVACTSGADEPEYKYGEAEMKSAVEGTWVLTLGTEGSSANQQITVEVVQSSKAQPDQMQVMRGARTGFIRSAAACGTRTFVASAQACIDSSQMPLDVIFVSGPDAYKGAATSGTLVVPSLVFSRGELNLDLGSVYVHAAIAPDGSVIGPVSAGDRGNGGSAVAVSVVSLVRTEK